eukprot:6629769-Prymnesium_polylepis.1
MRLSGSAAAAPRGAARCAWHCGASARSHARRHHLLASPQKLHRLSERLEPEEQAHGLPQRLRLQAFALEAAPARCAARGARRD